MTRSDGLSGGKRDELFNVINHPDFCCDSTLIVQNLETGAGTGHDRRYAPFNRAIAGSRLCRLVKVPRVFLSTVLKGCVSWAKENDVHLITEKEMEIIQDKRNKEKNNG